MRLALCQLPANPAETDHLPLALEALRGAAAAGATVAVLPELFRGPYFCQDMHPAAFDRAEAVPAGPTTVALQHVARTCGLVVVGSVFERAAPGLHYNTAIVIDADGRVAGCYRKAHIPCDAGYEEKFWFAPGDSGFPVFATRAGRIAVLVCWDQWFPEAARLAALGGAELIVYPTAIGSLPAEDAAERARQQDAWRTVQRGHAIANGCFVAAVNRAGREGQIDFWGLSFACGPQGEVIAEAGSAPATAIADVDLARVSEVRNLWPFFRDRRIDLYGDLLRRWRTAPGGAP
ncbi:MAG: acyltransferase [Myxococcales bacterium]|nr:acyltransferase [Myxococcales bacterium]